MSHPLRDMLRDDIDEVLRIIRLHDSDDARHARRSLEEYFASAERVAARDEAHVVYVDPAEDRIVGVCGYGPDRGEGRDVYWMGWMYVNPYFARRGIGTALLDEVLGRLQRLGARKFFTDTSSLAKYRAAVAFYERHGFQLEGTLRDYYQPGEHMLILGRSLG